MYTILKQNYIFHSFTNYNDIYNFNSDYLKNRYYGQIISKIYKEKTLILLMTIFI